MARTSQLLPMMLVMGTASCLVTAEPDFSPRGRTRPEIITAGPHSPEPNVAQLVKFWKNSTESFSTKEFSVWILSEDVDQDIRSVLLIDYGDRSGVSSGPYRAFKPGPVLPAGSLNEGPRRLAIPWAPGPLDADGCHTVTLLVTHQFTNIEGAYWCPASADDAATLTWFTTVCKDSAAGCAVDGCPLDDPSTTTYCEGVNP